MKSKKPPHPRPDLWGPQQSANTPGPQFSNTIGKPVTPREGGGKKSSSFLSRPLGAPKTRKEQGLTFLLATAFEALRVSILKVRTIWMGEERFGLPMP